MLRSRSFLLPALEEAREEEEEREGGREERREEGKLPSLGAPLWLARELVLLWGDIPGGGGMEIFKVHVFLIVCVCVCVRVRVRVCVCSLASQAIFHGRKWAGQSEGKIRLVT